jgi:transposase
MQAIGVGRGGRSTKIYAIVGAKGRPLNFIVTGGQVHDSQVVEEMLDTPNPPLAVAADKAYDSQKVRQQIGDKGALPVIPSRDNATRKAYCPKRIYWRRHKIENYFCRIKDWGRIAARYDKLARNNFLAAAALVGTVCSRGPRRYSLLHQIVSPDPRRCPVPFLPFLVHALGPDARLDLPEAAGFPDNA